MKVKQQNTHSLEHTCSAADRMNIGNRGASHLCNSYAKDMGWLTSENQLTHTLDPSKLGKQRRREREKIKAKEEKEISSQPVRSVYFDGEKNCNNGTAHKQEWESVPKNGDSRSLCLEEPQSVFSRVLRDSISHCVCLSVGRSVCRSVGR